MATPTSNSVLNVVSLDRPTLRNDLISFLQGQNQFQDYDFAGSNISVLIDLLSYNTNKEAFLVNMLFSEAFLDSAQLASSIASHAKELNYTPRSATSATANVTVTFQATGENQPYPVPKGSSFSTLIKNTQYVFSMPETLVVASANSTFSFTTQLYEGEYFKDGYAYVPSVDDPYPSFRITNPNVDVSSLTVVVFGTDSSLGQTYTLTTSLLDLTGSSRVYFLQQTNDGFYEVLFGDGITGAQPATGSNVVLDYRVTVGEPANSASIFAINFDPTGIFGESSNIKVVTNQNSIGGGPPESMGSVKYYAPRWYQTQERATAAPDYSTLLKVTYPEIQAVTAYGGEDANPPLYGRVIISVALTGLSQLPTSRQAEYTQFLNARMGLGLRLAFVDPLFTWVMVNSTVKYNVGVTANTPQRIESLVSAVIGAWNDEFLGDFQSTLLYSPFCTAIDGSDSSVISDSTQLLLYKKLNPTLTQPTAMTCDFQTPLVADLAPLTYPHPVGYETALNSDTYTFGTTSVRLEDDGLGNLNLVQDVNGITSLLSQAGTVDYSTGLVAFTITVTNYSGDSVRLFARAQESDLSSAFNTILAIEPAGINVTALPITVTS